MRAFTPTARARRPANASFMTTGHPAPETLWDEDLALLTLLLEHFGLRPSMETGLALYTAVLCRSAGFTDCPEFEGFERPALPEGADLGTLLVDFLYPESKNPGVWDSECRMRRSSPRARP